jgi:hypothetical protein
MLLRSIKRLWDRLAPCLAVALLAPGGYPAAAISRIKDIADFEGVRENQLVFMASCRPQRTGDDLGSAVSPVS